jgi:hypothetical protein
MLRVTGKTKAVSDIVVDRPTLDKSVTSEQNSEGRKPSKEQEEL